MKANEVPEKLYITLSELTEDGRTFVLDHHIDYPICTEYICTDAFIEKAQLFLIDKLKEIPMGSGKMKSKAECSLDKLIDEFRKYMKGE